MMDFIQSTPLLYLGLIAIAVIVLGALLWRIKKFIAIVVLVVLIVAVLAWMASQGSIR